MRLLLHSPYDSAHSNRDENPNVTFHHATTHDGVHIIYCTDRDKGIWFTPGSGIGPLQEKGRKILSKIVEGKH